MSKVVKAVRAIAVFGIGVVVGLLMGRVLPAMLVSGLVVVALFIALQLVRDQLMRAEATWHEAGDGDFSGVMIYDSAFTGDTTGELVTSEEGPTTDFRRCSGWKAAGYRRA